MASERNVDLVGQPQHLSRALSILAFNDRVLQQALDPGVPLLERLRFLTISAGNLDEFFEIRFARLPSPRHGDTRRIVLDGVRRLVARQFEVLHEVILPALADEGLFVRQAASWTPRQTAWARAWFHDKAAPLLEIDLVARGDPLPHIHNKNLSLVAALCSGSLAVVRVPRSLPRVLALPAQPGAPHREFLLLSCVLSSFVGDLFPQPLLHPFTPFRITRDSDLALAEDDVDDLVEALRGELEHRDEGRPVRLDVLEHCPAATVQMLLQSHGLTAENLCRVAHPISLQALSALLDLARRPDLRYARHTPRLPATPSEATNLFDVLRGGDVVLHHPYDAATPILELLQLAARDPDVLRIEQTLYRTGVGSPYGEALCEAARAGKEVVVAVEVQARFDEAANIELAARLRSAGARVLLGAAGHKIHCKMLRITRKEGGTLRSYVHLGTGNYHLETTRSYTDVGLLSADPVLAEDVGALFRQLSGRPLPRPLHKVVPSPAALRPFLIGLIDAEAARAKKGLPARILAKMNGLSDDRIIQSLYRASQAGVDIDLIVRGICCLRPGIAGLSERIRVRSIIGRFLEHARVFCFGNAGKPLVLCSSADWMERNLSRRIEICFPVETPALRERLLRECLEGALADNTQAWLMHADGSYLRLQAGDDAPFTLQAWLAAPSAPAAPA